MSENNLKYYINALYGTFKLELKNKYLSTYIYFFTFIV